jgi:3-phenylpropionate/trans-cinnamate dioxygenase ferredoxin reductase component
MTEPIVVVGGGLAAGTAVTELRDLGYDGDIVLLAGEPHVPYERPPLSKGFLVGETSAESAYVHPAEWYAEHGIDLRTGVNVTRIDTDTHTVTTTEGTVGWSRLLLATGARSRRLPLESTDAVEVRYLRTLDDSVALRKQFGDGRRLLVVGGGWIGMEVAASAHQLGTTVTVVEPAQQPLLAALGPEVGARFAAAHRKRGVDLRTGTGLAQLAGTTATLDDGSTVEVDTVLVGVGAVPNDELARDAGLEVDNGIVVDAFGCTRDPAIFAAGDVTNHPNALFDRRMRLESVHNAMEQAKAVARTIAGQPQAYADVPWFWSDQYDLKLQIAGVGGPDDALIQRGDPATRAFSCLHLRDGRLVAIDCINRGADFLAAKKLIAERRPIDPAGAADPEIRLSEL